MDQLRNPLPRETNGNVQSRLNEILRQAKQYSDRSYQSKKFLYEGFKQRIDVLNLSGEEYGKAICKLSKNLRV